jgi:D-alanyl-D-alanine dipeptidase
MQLPIDFIYLKDIDPTIIQSVRYGSPNNFVGEKIRSYNSSEIILTRDTAIALKEVQNHMKTAGYSLVVYDGYRSQTAVNHFIDWSQSFDESQKNLYYPTIDKKDVFSLGYVAKKSGHSRGSTVDLSIIKLGEKPHDIEISEKMLLDGSKIQFLDDGTIDMGSSFDLLHPASHHDSQLIQPEYLLMRNFLKKVMEDHGFRGYDKEWWHYTLENEPYPNTYFDFPIEENNQDL